MLPFVDTSLLVYFKGTAWEMPWLCVPVPQASVGSYSPDSLHRSRRARLHLLILQTCSSLHCPTWLLTVRDCHLASIMLTWSPSVLGTSGLQHPLLLPQRTTTQELLKGAGALVWGVRPPTGYSWPLGRQRPPGDVETVSVALTSLARDVHLVSTLCASSVVCQGSCGISGSVGASLFSENRLPCEHHLPGP